MKILVTGSGGMVGRNILEQPEFQTFQMLAPSRKELDLYDFQQVKSFMAGHRPDFIIHCAGRVGGIQANMANPVAFLVENLEINKNVILAAREAGVKNLINLGSSCMYPKDSMKPLTEDMVLKGELEPTNEGYAIAKIAAQRLCSYIHKEDPQYNYKTLIPCNLYGRFDKFEPQHSHMVPSIVRKLHQAKIENSSEVEIWGDGTARREFMYAGDLAEFISQAVQRFESLPELINVGLGFDYTVNEYYQAASEVIGYKGGFRHDLTKPVGMRQKLTSVAKANQWGWKSRTSLHEGLEKTYKFYLSLQK